MACVFLLLGSNLDNREQNIGNACDKLTHHGYAIIKKSSVYITEAWGNRDQPAFLNQVIQITCGDSAEQLLKNIQNIEQELGRLREQKWGPRLIDIDILYFERQIIHTEALTIPHPEIQNRRFTLVPLAEIAPNFIHPVLRKTSDALLNECTDPLEVAVFKS